MSTFGTDAREGLHTSYSIDFDGTSRRWESSEIIDVSSLGNSGDTISNKRKIADLSFSLYDGSGTIWTQLGNGTTAFGKTIALTISVGGTYGYVESQNGTEFKFLGTAESNDFNVHQGEIVNVSRKRNLITLRTQNKLNKINKLIWQMPVRTSGAQISLHKFFGSYAFYNIGEVGSDEHWTGTIKPHSLYNITEDERGGDFYAHTGGITEANFQGTGIFDTTGTGITNFLATDYEFLDTPFHQENPAKKFKGTFFGSQFGTIKTVTEAKASGYSSVADAEGSKVKNSEGTFYPLERIRVEFGTTLDSSVTSISESQLIQLTGDPTAVTRHCLFGKMVSDFLDESTDMGSTFAISQKIVAFQVYDQVIDPDVPKVETYINDALQMTSSIFFVSSNNQFEMAVYGPVDFSQTIDLIGTNEIFESSYKNDINDFYNRVTLDYQYDFQGQGFNKQKVGTLSDWNVINDRTFAIQSQWVRSDNQANNFVTKLLSRFEKTSPEINLDISLEASGRELGSLISVEDPDTFTGTKILQIVEYNKDFGGSKKISLRCLDGESLFKKRGYAKWEDSALAAVVSGTSKSGWGNAALGDSDGTVNNIDEDLFGTHFVWW